MLTRTFLHIPGIGETRERALWRAGAMTWDGYLSATGRLPRPWMEDIREEVLASRAAFDNGEWRHFEKALPANQKWRAFGELSDRVLYVDIETDGSMGPDCITVIGTFDGRTFRAFVADRDLDQAREYLEQFPAVATFNGALFDLPLIRARFRHNFFNHVHIDLRYPLRALGLRGGLKSIEHQMGIRRSPETQGLDGWDAVRLWNRHQAGDPGALERLLAYNEEDVRNLQPLLEWTYRSLKARCEGTTPPGGIRM